MFEGGISIHLADLHGLYDVDKTLRLIIVKDIYAKRGTLWLNDHPIRYI